MQELKITSIEELKKGAASSIVELPPFSEDEKFVARIRRPSLLKLVQHGKIPNELLTTANNLFMSGNSVNMRDTKVLPKIMDILDIVTDAAFVEPTYQELQEAEIELTDEQYMFIFNYAQKGVRALERFHTDTED